MVRWPALLVVAFLALPPYSFSGKANLIGYGICHQLPERSFFVGGHQLPLCARDTGTYLGAMATLAVLLAGKRRRRTGLPTTPVLVGAGARRSSSSRIDGVNSYADILPRGASALHAEQLPAPAERHGLRHRHRRHRPAAVQLQRLAGPGGRADTGRARLRWSYWRWRRCCTPRWCWAPGWLYYPLALVNVVGVLLVLAIVNGLLAYLMLGRERHGHSLAGHAADPGHRPADGGDRAGRARLPALRPGARRGGLARDAESGRAAVAVCMARAASLLGTASAIVPIGE